MQMGHRIEFLDTTLRDGNKLPFLVLDKRDRLEIAHQLARLGVDIIDAGYPAASPVEAECVRLLVREVQGPRISALSRAVPEDIDQVMKILADADKPYLHLFLPLSRHFMSTFLRKSREETLKLIEKTVSESCQADLPVQFSLAEITEAEEDFLLEAAQVAFDAGAQVVNLADSNGTLHPNRVRELIARFAPLAGGDTRLGVHFHNDLGMATANTLLALEAGARHVEATLGGLGTRSGNTPLEEVVFGLEAFAGRLELSHGIRLDQLDRTQRLLSYITGVQLHPNKPILGKCAFQDMKGSHTRDSLSEDLKSLLQQKTIGRPVDALFADQEMSPAGFRQQLENLGISLSGINVDKVYHLYLSQIKRKKVVHRAEVLSMVNDARLEERSPYTLLSFNVMTGTNSLPVGSVELKKGDSEMVQTSPGSGPIDALCRAVDKAAGLKPRLILYSVDSLTEGKDARAEVVVTLTYLGKRFHGHYGSTDVVEASLRAYLDAVNRIEVYRGSGAQEEFYIDGEYLWE
jgi:2-isopropylmalate synthase